MKHFPRLTPASSHGNKFQESQESPAKQTKVVLVVIITAGDSAPGSGLCLGQAWEA